VRCNDFDDEVYGQIISAIAISFSNLSDLEVNPKKIQLLLNSRRFALTDENHAFLEENLPNKSYLLIEQNIDEYFKNTTKFDLTNSELINLVGISMLSEVNKTYLIKSTPESAYDGALAKAYCEFDLSQSNEKLFDITLIKSILTFDLDEELKIKLFNRYSDLFDHNAIIEAIDNISVEVARLRVNGKPKLNKSDANLSFAKFLEANQYISVSENKKNANIIILNPKGRVLK